MVAAYGLAQAFGLDWPAGYTRPEQAVSCLGNRNAAAEFASLAGVSALWLASRGQRFAGATAVVILAYLVINGSRASLLAVGLGAFLIAIDRGNGTAPKTTLGQRHRLRLLAVLVLGGLAGYALDLARPAPTAPVDITFADSERPAPSTIAVRLELWSGCADMIRAAPIAGVGTGQFRYEYPRYRSQEEIELTSFGRQFSTYAGSAHNDYLELAVEGGLPALLLWLAFWFTVVAAALRDRGGIAQTAVPAVFLVHMLFRAPLGNAPAAALAMAYAGALLSRETPATARAQVWRRAAGTILGLALCWAGLGPLLGQAAPHDYLSRMRSGELAAADGAILESAVAWHGSESRLRSLLVRHRRNFDNDPQAVLLACRADLTEMATLDAHNTRGLLVTAGLDQQAGNAQAALAAHAQILKLDPAHPEATLALAALWFSTGEVARGIATLYARPHPRLRAVLGRELGKPELFAELRRRGDRKGVRILQREAAFIAALDAIGQAPGSAAADRAVRAYADLVKPTQPLLRVLLARQLLARSGADDAARLVPKLPLDLEKARLRLLEPVLAALRGVPAWRTYLPDATD